MGLGLTSFLTSDKFDPKLAKSVILQEGTTGATGTRRA